MAKTSRSAWKGRERAAAGLFGSQRNRCSGSSGRDDCSRSDSTHDRLFIETKLAASNATISLFDDTRKLAAAEGKIPVLLLSKKFRPGFLVTFASEDLDTLLVEYLAAKSPEAKESIEGAVRRAYLRSRGELEEDGDEPSEDE